MNNYSFFNKGVFDEFNFGYYLTIIGFIISIVGLIVSLKKKSDRHFDFLTTRAKILLSDNSLLAQPKLKIFYDNQEVSSLHEYLIYFYNEGSITYNFNEFIEPLLINLDTNFKYFNLNTIQEEFIYSSNKFFNPNSNIITHNGEPAIIQVTQGLIEPNDLIVVRLLYDTMDTTHEKFRGFGIKFKIKGVPEIDITAKGGDYFAHFVAAGRYYDIFMFSPLFVLFFVFFGALTLKLVCNISNLSLFFDALFSKVIRLKIDLELLYTLFFLSPFALIGIYTFKKFRNLFKPYVYLVDELLKNNRPSWEKDSKTSNLKNQNFYY